MQELSASTVLKKKPLLNAIEFIAAKLKNSALSTENYVDVLRPLDKSLQLVSKALKLSMEEAWMFALYFTLSVSENKVTSSSLNRHLNCSYLFLLRLVPIIDSLIEKKILKEFPRKELWLEEDRDDIAVLFVPSNILQFIIHDIPLSDTPLVKDENDFLEQMARHGEACRTARNSNFDIEAETLELRQEGKQFPLVQQVSSLGLSIKDQILLYLLIFYTITESDEGLKFFVSSVETSLMSRSRLKSQFLSLTHPLVNIGYVEITSGYIIRDNEIQLTPMAIDALLGFSTTDVKAREPKFQVLKKICPDEINNVLLYYPEIVHTEVRVLKRYCASTNFKKIRSRLKAAHLPEGLNILLHGEPGTGKTELVKQIAKQTKRVMLQVEMSDIKDKWVGESEKNVKQIFIEYQKASKYYDKKPILLLNEADALIQMRQSTGGGDSSVRDMLNTIQNILLQELEDFDGIMIATTNRKSNFDPAFERRFLYRVMVAKPDQKARRKIWKSRLSNLTAKELGIVSQLPLTGGQINNVIRKATVRHVLEGVVINDVLLKQLAAQEIGPKVIQKPVGFRQSA